MNKYNKEYYLKNKDKQKQYNIKFLKKRKEEKKNEKAFDYWVKILINNIPWRYIEENMLFNTEDYEYLKLINYERWWIK